MSMASWGYSSYIILNKYEENSYLGLGFLKIRLYEYKGCLDILAFRQSSFHHAKFKVVRFYEILDGDFD